jgi:hypothetical protein
MEAMKQSVRTIYLCSHTEDREEVREAGFTGPPSRVVRKATLCPKCATQNVLDAAARDLEDDFELVPDDEDRGGGQSWRMND